MHTAQKVMKQYIVLTMLNSMYAGFVGATYVIFMERFGLDFFEQVVVNAFFYATLVVMEIPTGVVADVYGRKISYLISCALATIGLVIYGFATTMLGFILAEIVLAVGMTFSSGAFKAWFVDRFHHCKHDEALEQIFTRGSRFGMIAAILSAIAGSYLYQVSPALPWFVSALFSLIAGIYGSLCQEEYFVRERISVTSKFVHLKIALVDFRKNLTTHGPFRFIVVVSFALHFFVAAPNMQWQHFFEARLHDETLLGYVYLVIKVAVFIGLFFASRVLKFFGNERRSIIWMQMLIAFSLMFAACASRAWFMVIAFMIHEVGRGVITPITDAYMHSNIVDSRKRATIDSCASMVYRCAGVVGLMFGGFLAKHFGISFTWMTVSVVLAAATITVALKEKKRK